SKGNGTSTTYAYDALSRIVDIIHAAPDGTINSRFLYEYDELGRQSGMSTLDGDWAYTYDSIGQLIRATFSSFRPDLQDYERTYVYDAAGNRVSTSANGQSVSYVSNSLNQHVSVGDATFQ